MNASNTCITLCTNARYIPHYLSRYEHSLVCLLCRFSTAEDKAKLKRGDKEVEYWHPLCVTGRKLEYSLVRKSYTNRHDFPSRIYEMQNRRVTSFKVTCSKLDMN